MSWFARRCQLCFRVGDRKCFLQPKRFFAQRVTPEVTCVLKPYVQPQGEADCDGWEVWQKSSYHM